MGNHGNHGKCDFLRKRSRLLQGCNTIRVIGMIFLIELATGQPCSTLPNAPKPHYFIYSISKYCNGASTPLMLYWFSQFVFGFLLVNETQTDLNTQPKTKHEMRMASFKSQKRTKQSQGPSTRGSVNHKYFQPCDKYMFLPR